MTLWLTFLFLAVSVREPAKLRSGDCSEDAESIADLAAGTPVEVRFAVAGGSVACYKVSVTVDGKRVEGYLVGSALADLDEFDNQRREGAMVGPRAGAPSDSGQQAARAAQSIQAGSPADATLNEASKLLSANQPATALTLLESAMQRRKRDPNLLALAGIAAWRSDDPRRALEYWRDSLDLMPNADLERLYEKVKREATNDKSGDKVFGLHFVLRYEGEALPSDIARTMLSVLDDEFARVSAQLGCPREERITAIVQPRDAYLRSSGASEWSGGQYDGRIRVALIEGTTFGPRTRRAFAHEIVHACLANIGRWPTWFHEGLAQKLSGDSLPPVQRRLFDEMAKKHALPRLEDLRGNWSGLSSEAARLAYAQSLYAIDLYLESSAYGLRNLMNNPDRLPQITADLDRLLGVE